MTSVLSSACIFLLGTFFSHTELSHQWVCFCQKEVFVKIEILQSGQPSRKLQKLRIWWFLAFSHSHHQWFFSSFRLKNVLLFSFRLGPIPSWPSSDISAPCWRGMSLLLELTQQQEGALGRCALLLLDYLQDLSGLPWFKQLLIRRPIDAWWASSRLV